MSVRFRIDHVLLEGVELPPVERARFQEALERELMRLLSDPAMLHGALDAFHGQALEALRAEPVTLTAGWDGASLGQQVARAVYGGLSR